MWIYIYVWTYMCVCVCVCVYIGTCMFISTYIWFTSTILPIQRTHRFVATVHPLYSPGLFNRCAARPLRAGYNSG